MPYTIKAFGRYWSFGKPGPPAAKPLPPIEPKDPFEAFIETLPDEAFAGDKTVPARPEPERHSDTLQGFPSPTVKRERAVSVECPICNAPVGRHCSWDKQRANPLDHGGRIRLVDDEFDQQMRQFKER